MQDQLTKLTQGMTFNWDGHDFDLTPSTITFLHHWNFGTSTQYYRDKNKFIALPDIKGDLVRITDIDGALDKALATYNSITEKMMAEAHNE